MKFLNLNRISLLKPINSSRQSLNNRFWLFQVVVIILILVFIFTIAAGTGMIAELSDNPYYAVKRDLDSSENQLSEKCLIISNATVELASKINKDIEKKLSSKGFTTLQLKDHPELINDTACAEVEKAVFLMERAGASGVFLFLNATINPFLDRAKDSKSGFYIVDMNQNVLPNESSQLFLLYGSAELAREYNMHMHTQWELEFNVGPKADRYRTDLFNIPFEAAIKNKGTSPNNLGHWNPLYSPADNTDKVISFSVPLIDKEGNPYGVCGLEVSKNTLEKFMSYKLPFEFKREVVVFSTQQGNDININNGLFFGSNTSWMKNNNSEFLHSGNISESNRKLRSYYFNSPSDKQIVGYNIKARLYPESSVFKDSNWTLAMLMPRRDVVAKTTRIYYALGFLIILFIGSIIMTYFTSKYCVRPLLETIQNIKDNELQTKTNILEIDDLIEFLKERSDVSPYEIHNVSSLSASQFESHNEALASTQYVLDENNITADTKAIHKALEVSTGLSNEKFAEFENRLTTLSNAERNVFDLYIKGYTAKEICLMLFISINTLKTHNKRIYKKMNVSSRAELLSYCYNLMDRQ